MPIFDAGEVYKTDKIDKALCEDASYVQELVDCFVKYLTGNWGDLDDEVRISNDLALVNQQRLLATYKTSKGTICITTNFDRAITNILFEEEF